MEDRARTRGEPPRKGMKSLVLTGLIGGAGSAVVLPLLWELVIGSIGMSAHWLGQYVVVFVIGGLLAAPIWGGIGALAGYCAGLIWRREEYLGSRRTVACMLLIVAAMLGSLTGIAGGVLFSSVPLRVVFGLGAAAIASAVTSLKIRQLKRAERCRAHTTSSVA